MTRIATTKDTASPTMSAETKLGVAKSARPFWARSKTVAAPSVGIASRNENSAAVFVLRPASWPPRIVVMDRDAPGHNEKP
jgi:hypothetical protein